MEKQARSTSIGDLISECEEAVRNAIILEPNLPSLQIAERLLREFDPEMLAPLSHALLLQHFAKLIRTERAREARAERAQLALPGFEHLPLKIAISKKDRVHLYQATYTDLRAYCWRLGRNHRDRRRNDVKFKEAKSLLEKVHRQARKHRGITVAEVVGVELPTER